MRTEIMAALALLLLGCGSQVVLNAVGDDPPDDPPTVPDDMPADPPTDPTPEDPPLEDPRPTCDVAVSIETIGGSLPCEFGGVSNLAPGTLLAVEAAPEIAGLRFEMQGCPAGGDCVCAVTVSCVGADIASTYAGAMPVSVASWIQPNEITIGPPAPWECIDCGYGPAFFYAASELGELDDGTLSVQAGALTSSQVIGGAEYETRTLDGVAFSISGLAPVQTPLGDAMAEEGQTVALVMDDDFLRLSLRNLRSTWCVDGCGTSDPAIGSVSWVVFGPAP